MPYASSVLLPNSVRTVLMSRMTTDEIEQQLSNDIAILESRQPPCYKSHSRESVAYLAGNIAALRSLQQWISKGDPQGARRLFPVEDG